MTGSPGYDLLVTAIDDLEIVPLTAARFPDLAALFEEGGDPKWCWYNPDVGTRTRDDP